MLANAPPGGRFLHGWVIRRKTLFHNLISFLGTIWQESKIVEYRATVLEIVPNDFYSCSFEGATFRNLTLSPNCRVEYFDTRSLQSKANSLLYNHTSAFVWDMVDWWEYSTMHLPHNHDHYTMMIVRQVEGDVMADRSEGSLQSWLPYCQEHSGHHNSLSSWSLTMNTSISCFLPALVILPHDCQY